MENVSLEIRTGGALTSLEKKQHINVFELKTAQNAILALTYLHVSLHEI